MSSPEHQIQKALTALIFDHCFYGQLAMQKLTISVNPALRFGMATDGVNLFYSPTWIVKTPDWELQSVTAHEVIHCANGHVWRRGNRDWKLWNYACDYVTNLILVADGFKLWKGALIDQKYVGWSAEEVYSDLLREKQAQQQQPEPQPDAGGAGAPQGQPEDSDEPEGQDGDEDPSGAAGGAQDDEPESEDEDSSGAGSSDEDESEDQDSAGAGEEEEEDENPQPGGMLDPADSGIDPESLQVEWAVAVFQAAQAAQAMGQMPAGLRQIVKDMRESKVDWKSLTLRFVQMCAKEDWTMRFPNQRYTYDDFYMPALRSELLPPIVIHWDTSGSRDYDEARKECATEIKTILEECKPERTYVMYCDTEIAEDGVEIFEPGDPIEFHPSGGGGTSIKPVFDRIERDGIQPVCMISITDLDIYDLDSIPEPDFPVLWLKIGGHRQDAPFGEVIVVEPEHRH